MNEYQLGLAIASEITTREFSSYSSGLERAVALAREVLDDPNWPLHAARALGADEAHETWPREFGWWLNRRDRLVAKLGLRD